MGHFWPRTELIKPGGGCSFGLFPDAKRNCKASAGGTSLAHGIAGLLSRTSPLGVAVAAETSDTVNGRMGS